jgi:hypothetical protein
MATVFSMSESSRTGTDPAWIKRFVTGSILALVLIGGVPTFQHLLRRKPKSSTAGSSGGTPGRGSGHTPRRAVSLSVDALHSLRFSILGHCKKHILLMLGPPKALGNGEVATWYYILDNADHVAMAIRFDDDHAGTVEFFKSPV